MNIAVDFDSTVVESSMVRPLKDVPGAVKWLREWVKAGARLHLWTVRCDDEVNWGPMLTEAVKWYQKHNIPLAGVNCNPHNPKWYTSPKPHFDLLIDDTAFGCPLRSNPRMGGKEFVDWDIVGPAVLAKLQSDTTMLKSDHVLVLSDEDRDTFLAAMDNPPAPNAKLMKAAKAYKAAKANGLRTSKMDEIRPPDPKD